MSTTYDGDPDNNPTSITLTSDGDQPFAVSVDAALEGLKDSCAYLTQHTLRQVHQAYDAAISKTSTTYVDVAFLLVDDCKAGDVLVADFSAVISHVGSDGLTEFQMFYIDDVDGTPAEDELGPGGLPGYAYISRQSGENTTIAVNFPVSHTVTADGDTHFVLRCKASAGTVDIERLMMRCLHYRLVSL